MNIQKGDIYIVTCNVTNKSYIGQARQYITKNKQSWGYEKRWLRHIYEADKNKKGKNQLIHQMIREHGKDSFELKRITECDVHEMDKLEKQYIKEYNTIHPNGYNMTSGGQGETTHAEITNEKKKVKRREFTEEVKLNMRIGQIGKKFDVTRRKEDTQNLPKYIMKLIRKGKHVGYRVQFNNGIEKKQLIEKNFQNSNNLESALSRAKEYLKDIQEEFDLRFTKYKKEQDTKAIVLHIMENNIQPELPEHVYPIYIGNDINGYFVYGLKAFDGSEIPRRDFTANQNTHNINNCVKFIDLIKQLNDQSVIPEDWTTIPIPCREKLKDLPNNIRATYYNGIHNGYRVEYFVKYDENKKQVVETKCFSSKKLSMEEKLKMAINYLEEIKKKHN